MTKPRFPSQHSSSSTNKHLLFLTKILFVLIILLLLPQFVTSKTNRRRRKRKLNKSFNDLRTTCATKPPCNTYNEAENEMCITQCMNQGCHEKVYTLGRGGELEPGEVDEGREVEFESCVKEFLRKQELELKKAAASSKN
mmetsp:Transcript_19483/g.24021  ORF Transcript_19483/g.24021 Transcript_19483/m.24021 type:complete len:140 (+) Transcript_19483:76-495(+)